MIWGMGGRTLAVALWVGVLIAAASPSRASANPNMRSRFDMLFRIGFAGELDIDPGPDFDADSSPGFDLRGDFPVARHVTLGPQFSFYAARPDNPNLDRNPIIDISPFIKGRYPFKAGKKKAEVYGIFQVGLSMVFLRDNLLGSDEFGPGWNIGLAPGIQILLARRFGLITEIGWLRTQGNFDNANLILNQGVWRFGFVF